MISIKTIALAVAATLIYAGGLMTGWQIYRPKQASPVTMALAVRQPDKSLILPVQPDLKPKPKQMVPNDATVERVISVVVAPTVKTSGTSQPATNDTQDSSVLPKIPCPPVTVDLTLVSMKDLSQRVIASSPDGDIVGGIDIPVSTATIKSEPKWSVIGLAGYDAYRNSKVYGFMVSKDIGPITANCGLIGMTAFVGVGIRW